MDLILRILSYLLSILPMRSQFGQSSRGKLTTQMFRTFPLNATLILSLDYLVRLQTAGPKVDNSFPPIAKWWPRYSNCLAVCTGLAVNLYVLSDSQSGQRMDISGGRDFAISIPVETGVRDFAFSADGSALAVVDYVGDVLLWALRSDTTFAEFYNTSLLKSKVTLSKPTIKLTLPSDLNPCSIQFLGLGDDTSSGPFTPLLLVGSSYNRHLHLVDISQGMMLQEIVLPSISFERMPAQNFSMTYTKEKRFLTIGDTLSNSIFFFHLHSPVLKYDSATSQSDFLVNVVEANFSGEYRDGTSPSFDYVTEIPFFPHHRLQTLAVTTAMYAVLDVFTAHSNGFTMLSPNLEDILPDNYSQAKHAATKDIPKPILGRVVEPIRNASPIRNGSTPPSRSLSRRSSAESVRSSRSKASPLVKKESVESFKDFSVNDKTTTKTTPDRRNSASEIVSRETPPIASPPEKQRSPSPVVQRSPSPVVENKPSSEPTIPSIDKDFQTFFTQAFEEQCTSFDHLN
jgi:hypothetical protein